MLHFEFFFLGGGVPYEVHANFHQKYQFFSPCKITWLGQFGEYYVCRVSMCLKRNQAAKLFGEALLCPSGLPTPLFWEHFWRVSMLKLRDNFNFLGDFNATFQMVAFLTEIDIWIICDPIFLIGTSPIINQSTSGMPCWLCCSRHWALDSFHVTGRLIMIISRGCSLIIGVRELWTTMVKQPQNISLKFIEEKQ